MLALVAALVLLAGYATQRGSVCAVRATNELVLERKVSRYVGFFFCAACGLLVMALGQEIQITENFNKITEHCQKARDYQTARFVQWYLDEQYEEERQARRCLEIFDQMNAKDAIFDIDREIHDLKKKE